ncbi:MAG: type II toxin-antitoxin system Phd/YefM family antitoxin [Cyanobacteria bacterium P01_A01_bin.40]
MPKYLTIAEAQTQLAELSSQLNEEPAIITRDGKPVMITFGMEQFESLMETIEIISDREFMADFKQGIQEAQQEETMTLEELKTDLSLD